MNLCLLRFHLITFDMVLFIFFSCLFGLVLTLTCFSNKPDLRDDKQFFIDHPGAVPITAAQVRFMPHVLTCCILYLPIINLMYSLFLFIIIIILLPFTSKGEELRKLINAPAYIECSSKTQEVYKFSCSHFFAFYLLLAFQPRKICGLLPVEYQGSF